MRKPKKERVQISAEVFKEDKEWLEKTMEGFNMSKFIRTYLNDFVGGKKMEKEENISINGK